MGNFYSREVITNDRRELLTPNGMNGRIKTLEPIGGGRYALAAPTQRRGRTQLVVVESRPDRASALKTNYPDIMRTPKKDAGANSRKDEGHGVTSHNERASHGPAQPNDRNSYGPPPPRFEPERMPLPRHNHTARTTNDHPRVPHSRGSHRRTGAPPPRFHDNGQIRTVGEATPQPPPSNSRNTPPSSSRAPTERTVGGYIPPPRPSYLAQDPRDYRWQPNR